MELLTKLSQAVDMFEESTTKLPPDLNELQPLRQHIHNLLECKNYSLPELHKNVVDESKDMLNVHLTILTNCINNASTYLENELTKYN